VGGIRARVAALAVLAVGLSAPAQALAADQVGTTFAPPTDCAAGSTYFQFSSVTPSFDVPSDGVVVSWSFEAGSSPPTLKLKVVRYLTTSFGTDSFVVVGDSTPQTPAPNAVNTFPTRIPVRSGDVIGMFISAPGKCRNDTPPAGFGYRAVSGDPAPGTTFTSVAPSTFGILDIAATVEPDCDGDGFGDETQDSDISGCAPASGPDTTITKRPKDKTKKKFATFEFSSSQPGAHFECSLNGGPFNPCSSPHKVKAKKGKNHFAVRAAFLDNTDPSPATDDWKFKKKKKK
jgi:hypothetical protein